MSTRSIRFVCFDKAPHFAPGRYFTHCRRLPIYIVGGLGVAAGAQYMYLCARYKCNRVVV